MKRKVSRSLVLLVALVFVLGIVAGCGGTAATATATTAAGTTAAEATTKATEATTAAATTEATTAGLKATTITYATYQGEAEKDQQAIAFKPFMEKNPTVKIETQVFDHDSYQQKLPVMAKSNTLPDLFWWNSTQLVDSFKNTTGVADLTPYIDETWKKDFNKYAWASHTTADGKIVGFPAEMGFQGMMFNKALFDKFGLTIPKTYPELVECVKTFKKNNVTAIAMGTKDPWPTWEYEEWFVRNGSADPAFVKATFVDGTTKITDPAGPYAVALNAIGQLADLGAFPENASTLNYEQVVALFTAGNAACVSIPTDQLAKVIGTPLEKDFVMTWGLTFPDSKGNNKHQAFGCSNAYGVSAEAAKDADKIAAIVALEKYHYSEEGYKLTLKTGAVLPMVFKADLSSYGTVMQSQAKMLESIANGEVECDTLNPTNAYTYYGAWDKNWEAFGSKFAAVYGDIALGLMNGSIKTSEIAAKLAKGQTTLDGVIKAWKATK